ncbi:hypothetical protein OAI29_08035 [Amylibacter sp.]|nr:hypothetical protein [Amylibacter sp.]
MNMLTEKRAKTLIAPITKQVWDEITGGNINLRRLQLEELCCDIDHSGNLKLKYGLPGLYLFGCLDDGDQVAFDLLTDLGTTPNIPRPKTPGGKDANAARDFTLSYLSKVLMLECPELFQGANDTTHEGTSAIDMIRKALEDSGFGCIDNSKPSQNCPVPRSAERAVRRFREKAKYREIFW